MKKCSVDLVTGFLSSGKTTFINVFLKKTLKGEETIVVRCESGKEELNEIIKNKGNLSIKNFISGKELTEERFIRMVKFYKPERMIIECNGIEDIDYLTNLFNTVKLRSYFRITGMINMIDASTFSMLLKNLGHLVLPCLERSDLIIFNKASEISEEKVDVDLNIIKNLNNHAHILVAYDKSDLEKKINKAKVINA